MTLEELQTEQAEWAAKNFGAELTHEKACDCALGVCEELGELSEAILNEDEFGINDAIGDVVIYLADVCTRKGWELTHCYTEHDESASRADESSGFFELFIHAGKLCHSLLKTKQGIRLDEPHDRRGQVAVGSLIGALENLCITLDIDIYDCFTDAWAEVVSKRDWNAERESETAEAEVSEGCGE